jgi:lipopolysaccharide assembly protein B
MPTEATFLLAGLFIIAGAAGWVFARYSDRDREEPLPARISADYIRGLSLVLDRRTDEALELFVQMAKVDEDTLETHFALGHLFRRRGEIDRAIRVHENLLARSSLTDPQRDQAQLALAEDYLGAGLFDRAEDLFSKLGNSGTLAATALERLVHIYEREREWQKAIDAHRRLEVLSGEKSNRIAHYYCELAEEARAAGDRDLARQYLKSSVRSESGALRGSLIRAALATEEGDHAQALRLYEQVLDNDRRFIVEVLGELVECYRVTKREKELDAYLRKLISTEPALKKDLAHATIVRSINGIPALAECVEDFILHNEVLANLVDAEEFIQADEHEKARATERISSGLRQLAMTSARYRCANCGYSTQRLIWHCPSCKAWESIRPIQTFQFDGLIV